LIIFKLELPQDGVFIHGLYMDAFKWDYQNMKCAESNLGEMNFPLPMLHMEPKQNFNFKLTDYLAPLYKTSARAGSLSTTGKLI
jgi:dynein heavy chain, axonemal